jgi:isoamylase
VKLIAEPWDVGEGGYQVGGFPPLWAEWNGRYRDTIRDLWRGADVRLGEVAYRVTGSSDLYEADSRRPHASINFITAHDGFTMRDLVSYHDKRNHANGEENNDGESHNRSWNCGVEGPTDDEAILGCRSRQQRNLVTTLMLSQGVPMLLGGDEMGRTQRGNNNAYCQDNEISWYDWDDVDEDLLEFTSQLIAFRQEHPSFRRRRFFQGRPIHGSEDADLVWFGSDGTQVPGEVWDTDLKVVAMFINGDAVEVDRRGELVTDDTFLLVINGHGEPISVVLPDAAWGERWCTVLDTTTGFVDDEQELLAGTELKADQRSMLLLRRVS